MTWELLLKMLDAFHLKFLKISNSGTACGNACSTGKVFVNAGLGAEHRPGDTNPIIAETISNLIMVCLTFRACPWRRLRHDKRSGLHSSDHMTRAP